MHQYNYICITYNIITVFILFQKLQQQEYGKAKLGPLGRDDAGIYICRAENKLGQKTEQMTRLEILCEYVWMKLNFKNLR